MSDMAMGAFAKALQNQTSALRSKDGLLGDDRLNANDRLGGPKQSKRQNLPTFS